MTRPARHPLGLQLIEVIIASSVFFLAALFLLTILPSSQWASKKAQTKMTAESLAFSEIEKLKGRSFASLVGQAHPPQTKKANEVDFLIETTVQTVGTSDPDLLREVEVTVTWTERSESKSIKTSAYVSKVRH